MATKINLLTEKVESEDPFKGVTDFELEQRFHKTVAQIYADLFCGIYSGQSLETEAKIANSKLNKR